MKAIIAPIERAVLKSELNNDRFLRKTRKGDNEIYPTHMNNSLFGPPKIKKLLAATASYPVLLRSIKMGNITYLRHTIFNSAQHSKTPIYPIPLS